MCGRGILLEGRELDTNGIVLAGTCPRPWRQAIAASLLASFLLIELC